MKKNRAKLAALLLAVCMILPLAACGKSGGDSQQLSGKVYVPQIVDCALKDVEYISQGCSDGQNLYVIADVRGEEKEDSWTDPDTGETEVYTYYESRTGIFRIPLDGGEAAELENYAMPEAGDDSNVYLSGIQIGEDGTVWVTENMTVYQYDLPEDFNEETDGDDKWQYQTDYEDITIRRQLDSTGKEISRQEIPDLSEKLEVDYVGNVSFDKAGNVYARLENKITVLDKDLNPLFDLDSTDMWGSLVQMADGSMAMMASYEKKADDDEIISGTKLMFVDMENKSWGQEYEMSYSAHNIIPGGGDYLFYYSNRDSIYGWKAGAAEGEKLFSWLSSGLNSSDINFFTFLSDGRVAAVVQDWNEDGIDISIAILTPTDVKDLPEKTTLTMAAMWLGYDTRNKIMEFNKNSDTCRIEVVDYSEYSTAGDMNAGLTKLNTEIVAGNVPDLIYTSSLPVDRYASKGILEDLWPYIEADAEIGGREALMEHVLDVASIDGKLYQAFSSFGIVTAVGPVSVVGDRMSWTLADLQAALAAMPDGCTILGEYDTKDNMLNRVLSMNMSQFVDWEAGKCSFDSDGFKALLAFCNSFPDEYVWDEDAMDVMSTSEWESEYARMLNGKQLLTSQYLYDFSTPQLYNQLFNGCSFVGYPKEDGSVGSSFSLGTGIAMSSTCKDKEAAWSFIREQFLPQAGEDNYDESSGRYYFSGFPVNKSDFEKYQTSAMTESYEEDENGQPVLDENGQPVKLVQESWYITDDKRVEIYAATQEDIDQTMALYNAVDSIDGYDQNIYEVIEEQIGAYFAGDKDVDATASEIQNRVQLYMGENM